MSSGAETNTSCLYILFVTGMWGGMGHQCSHEAQAYMFQAWVCLCVRK